MSKKSKVRKLSKSSKDFVRYCTTRDFVIIEDWKLLESDGKREFTGRKNTIPVIHGKVYTKDRVMSVTTAPLDGYDESDGCFLTLGNNAKVVKWKLGTPDDDYIDKFPAAAKDLPEYFSQELVKLSAG